MLQQTAVGRVQEAWARFLAAYPTPQDCARAPQSAIIRQWQGLGYPRRAVALHQTSRILAERGGEVPRSIDELLQLPGIGNYTARAIASFAYGVPVGVVERHFPEQPVWGDRREALDELQVPARAAERHQVVEVGGLDDERAAFPVAARVSKVLADRRAHVRPAVERDEPVWQKWMDERFPMPQMG